VQDLLLISLWAAINLSWFTAAFNYYQHKATLKAVANGLKSATGQQFTKELARTFGATLAPNLVLLFYPISRGSVVMQTLGISYPAGIRCDRSAVLAYECHFQTASVKSEQHQLILMAEIQTPCASCTQLTSGP
jgi:hypothetical protein